MDNSNRILVEGLYVFSFYYDNGCTFGTRLGVAYGPSEDEAWKKLETEVYRNITGSDTVIKKTAIFPMYQDMIILSNSSTPIVIN